MKIQQIIQGIREGDIEVRYHKAAGMIQLYLTDDVRMHVFHHGTLPQPEEFGFRHNHRFHLTSLVLMGEIINTELDVKPYHFTGNFYLYDVQPALLGEAVPVRCDDNRYQVEITGIRRIKAGQQYRVRKWAYHQTQAHGLTVTIIRKSEQSEHHARILAYKDQVPEHALTHDKPNLILRHLAIDALSHLTLHHEGQIAQFMAAKEK